ncbi:endolytic transglycosylase MltG [Microbacterium sp. ET2]|uniref:endolytic transglycosylase MltG n=1 Tax=Microbacterium albipurpureum TaxID=3050384 RepID=UPI00259D1A14|nr:endolytic transglycosylase MltG [Microbacterium sp. ET2 (Ac-2212)]WJL95566.1 endolytic transglycosylase MltG [Microbacterium sp. ET2 (Ac-2212)]
MPDHPSSEDPFADLFGKLPDPRTRDSRRSQSAPETPGAADAPAGGRATAQPASEDAPGPAAPPPSRRAAREAALRSTDAPSAPVPAPRSDPAPIPAPRDAQTPVSAGLASAAPSSAERGATRTATRPAGTATLEDLFTGEATTEALGSPPPKPDRRRRRIGAAIAIGLMLAIIGGIVGGGLYVWNTYESQIREVMGWEEPADFEDGLANGEALVTIVSGDTGQSISQTLFEAGVTKTSDAFYDYLIDNGRSPTFMPGVYRLQLQMTSEAALAAIENPENKLENSALIPEGQTAEATLEIVAESLGMPLEDLQAAAADPAAYGVPADSLEGWLFPAMYTFDPGVTASDVIQTMVDRTVQSLDAAGVPVDDRQRILIIASIIQREARYEADMQKVSRVIQNRLDPGNQETFGKLQMDSTAQYGVGESREGVVSSSEEALTDPNPWNTYVQVGLPIGPIANPGDVAINAAMNPADGPWLYFVTVNLNTGETIFTETYDEHLRYVEQWREWCRQNPDAGC